MKIKVALIDNLLDLNKFPDAVRKALIRDPYPQCRIVNYDDPNNFIHILDKVCTYIKSPCSPEINNVEKGTLCKTDFYRNCDCMYFVAKGHEHIVIAEVDTDRPWFIGSPEDSNTGEFIMYADYEVTNTELNYVKPKDLSGFVFSYEATKV